MRKDPARFLIALFFAATPAVAEVHVDDDLPRQADLGFAVETTEGQLVVADVTSGSAAEQAGLRNGDLLVSINGAPAVPDHVGRGRLEAADADDPLRLRIRRSGRERDVIFSPPPRPFEQIPGMDSYYGVVETSDGSRLRTIIARPEGTSGADPALFVVQWVACGSIEYDPQSVSRQILADLARRSGRVLVRVERSTSGDSQGPRCHQLDYNTELQHYVEAFRQLLDGPHVDAGNVVLLGSSLGSTMAPLVARQLQDEGIRWAGIVVQGGGAVTYLERMINFERQYLERRPEIEPAGIHHEMLNRIRFQYEYLVEGRSPDEIAADSEAMARVRADTRGLGDGVQYGRPYAWHQQAATHDFLSAWAELEAPVLVIFNEFDQFEGRHGHRLIVDVVNRLRPGTAEYIEQAQVGHSNFLYPTVEDAYAGEMGIAVPQLMVSRIGRWLSAL